MTPKSTVELQVLIDRLRQGDRGASRDLLERAHERLCKLARRILSGSFPALRDRHDLDSVVDETWLRLLQALESSQPPTTEDFFRLAAHKIRHVLLDLAARERRRLDQEIAPLAETSSGPNQPQEPADRSHDPARLALWTELHEQVAALPEQERTVFEMHYYLGLPQAEIARLLELHPRKVSYLWVAATDKLARFLSGIEAFASGPRKRHVEH
jgi:RNA polymerase sigma factor (sigma-70 family)